MKPGLSEPGIRHSRVWRRSGDKQWIATGRDYLPAMNVILHGRAIRGLRTNAEVPGSSDVGGGGNRNVNETPEK